MTKSARKKQIIASVIAFAIGWAAAGFVLAHLRNLNDWMILRNFAPSAEIAKIPAATGMSKTGEKLFFVAQPEIVNAAKFQEACPSYERSVVLGCYLPANQKIFLFNVKDSRITEVKSVTAAHEMLHVAFARLSQGEKNRVSELIRDFYATIDDEDLRKRMKLYEENEPGLEIEELFCILGTEFSDLNSELENFYAKYFSEREKVVALNNSYKKVFAELTSKRENLANELAKQESAIKFELRNYRSGIANLEAAIADFNACAAEIDCFASESDFYLAREKLIGRRDFLDDQRESVKQKIANYNQAIGDLRALGVEIEELNESMSAGAELEKLELE